MSSSSSLTARIDPASIRNRPGLFLVVGALMVTLGVAAIAWSCLTTVTIAATWVFGVVLLAGGVTEVVSAFRGGRGGHRLLHLLIGTLYIVVGLMIMDSPGKSAVQLTLIIAVFMIVGGIFRILYALAEPVPNRGALLFNGVITLLLGGMIYRQWPSSGLWVIGLFLGVELMLTGWLWIAMALAARKGLPGPAAGPSVA